MESSAAHASISSSDRRRLVWTAPYLPTAVLLVVLAPAQREFELGVAVLFVVAYAIVDNVRIPFGPGFASPSQLVFLPMLALLPPTYVPLLVLLGVTLGRVPGIIRDRTNVRRLPLALPNSAFELPPAVVIALLGAPSAAPGHWPAYGLAVATQIGATVALAYPDLKTERSPVRLLGYVVGIDILLAPAGLTAAFIAEAHPWAATSLIVGLCALGAILAAERSQRLLRQFQAFHDPLTGLANRALFAELLRHAVSTTTRSGEPGALLLVDLDGFKAVNDTHGHEHGDLVLVETAARMERALRASDVVARLGGDEFAVVLPNESGPAQVDQVLTRLRNEIERPHALGDITVCVGASIGLALFPADGVDADALLAHADQAMYREKRGTRTGDAR